MLENTKINYKETLNLPQTDFPMKANLSQKEPDIQQKFTDYNIYQKIREASKGKPNYILHDGPPYANGNIHIGHALNKILKDIVVKYKTMQGLDAPYVPGWDCHGLPIEHQLLKELKKSQHEVEQVEFRKKAYNYSNKFVRIQREEFERLGIFGDWDRPYLTLNNDYEKAIIDSFIDLYQKGYIYKGLRPIHWCTTCETALAEAEVEYENHTSPSIYVKFAVKSDLSQIFKNLSSNKKTFFLIWTTTPWTLPANLAIAVKEDYTYAALETDNEIFIIAHDLVESVAKETQINNYKIAGQTLGKDLNGVMANHPFIDQESKIILGEHVTLEQGTGCVHIAPGHGEDDFLLGLKYGLEIYNPVNNQGLFTDEVEHFKGLRVFEANGKIIKHMKDKGVLLFESKVSHSYPHCWRCKNPIIFRTTKQWFLRIDHNNLRDNLLKEIKKINWIPKVGEHRISGMVENRPDWCLSRQRLWGVPIPMFYCKQCGTELLDKPSIEKIKSIIDKEGIEAWFSKDTEYFIGNNTLCKKCGKASFAKEKDILDVWFESGVSHQGVLKTRNDLKYPADLYLEGSDQHRGWFQTSLITAVGIENATAFKTVLTHGFVVDGEGKKMSKSLGNVIAPQEVIKKFGADILRLWVSSVDYSNDVRISDEILKQLTDAYRKIRNTFRFLLSNLYDFNYEEHRIEYKELDEIDKWALSKLQKLIKKTTKAYENFDFCNVYHTVYNFCIVEMSSFYLDVLKDRLYTFAQSSYERRSSQTVLFKILEVLTTILAPILSFTSQEVWSFLPAAITKNIESVHLTSWIKPDESIIDEDLEEKWEKLIKVREDTAKILEEKRKEKLIGSSLAAKVVLATSNDELYALLRSHLCSLPAIFIVSQTEVKNLEEINKADFLNGENLKDLYIQVVKADGQKCERCWNYSPSVGKSNTYSTICHRCISTIKN